MVYERTFDSRDRLGMIAHSQSDGGALITSFEYDHPYNAVGEPQQIIRRDDTTVSYIDLTYDPALRLQKEEYFDGDPNSGPGTLTKTISYTYAAAGNRTSRTVDGAEDLYKAAPASDYLLGSHEGPDGISGTTDDGDYGYDAGGRLISFERGGDDWDLDYNAAGQITDVTRSGDTPLSYEYDALGQRTSASEGSNTYDYLIAPAAQRLGAGVLDVEVQHLATNSAGGVVGWVYAGENPILRYDANGNVDYYLESANDTIASLLKHGGSTDHYEFDAFGNVLSGPAPTSAAGGDFGFHAAWRDDATGLYHMRARSYDPETGRFLTPDPAEPNPQVPESYNPYAFA